MSDDDRPFPETQDSPLQRGSRRKQRRRAQPGLDDQGDEQDSASDPVVGAVDDAAEIELPRLEDLDENSDYSAFLNPKVAEDLRRVALRKLFRSAIFNVRDGLDDYDEDFTVYEPLGDVVTADMRHEMRRKAERAKEQLAESGSLDEATVVDQDNDQPVSETETRHGDSPESDEAATRTALADTESEPDAGVTNPCKPTS